MDDFTTAFPVDQTPGEVFEAITDVRGWWSGQIDGHTGRPGDEFTYRYEDLHRCRIRVTEADPGHKVTWLVLDGGPAFTRNKREWQGTTISFEISQVGGQTEVRFTHRGLVPQLECFGACSSAWGSYINGSLRSLITTGKGYPSPASSDSSLTEIAPLSRVAAYGCRDRRPRLAVRPRRQIGVGQLAHPGVVPREVSLAEKVAPLPAGTAVEEAGIVTPESLGRLGSEQVGSRAHPFQGGRPDQLWPGGVGYPGCPAGQPSAREESYIV